MTAGCRIKWQGSSTSAVTPVGFTFGASLLDQISPALTETDAPKPNGEIPSHRLCVLPDLLVRSIDLLCVADLNQHSEPIVAETHVPQLEAVAREVEATIIKIMKEAASG